MGVPAVVFEKEGSRTPTSLSIDQTNLRSNSIRSLSGSWMRSASSAVTSGAASPCWGCGDAFPNFSIHLHQRDPNFRRHWRPRKDANRRRLIDIQPVFSDCVPAANGRRGYKPHRPMSF
jgi:hypothetical protein